MVSPGGTVSQLLSLLLQCTTVIPSYYVARPSAPPLSLSIVMFWRQAEKESASLARAGKGGTAMPRRPAGRPAVTPVPCFHRNCTRSQPSDEKKGRKERRGNVERERERANGSRCPRSFASFSLVYATSKPAAVPHCCELSLHHLAPLNIAFLPSPGGCRRRSHSCRP